MQTTTLKVTLGNGEFTSDTGLIFPCAFEEFGCETTSLDPMPASETILTFV